MDADEAIAEVIAVEGGRLLRLAFQLSHDRWIAEDLVQQALENVYRRWRRSPVDDVSNREAYARKAVVNEFLRRRRLRAATEIVTDQVPDAEIDAHDQSAVERDVVWRALGALPPRQRAAIVLRYYEDLPDADIAALLGCRLATVRSLLARGVQALRATMTDSEPVTGGAR